MTTTTTTTTTTPATSSKGPLRLLYEAKDSPIPNPTEVQWWLERLAGHGVKAKGCFPNALRELVAYYSRRPAPDRFDYDASLPFREAYAEDTKEFNQRDNVLACVSPRDPRTVAMLIRVEDWGAEPNPNTGATDD